MKLDTDFVRAQFPAFSDPALAGWRHFENAGGSYACGQVIDRLTRFYTQRKLQPYGPAGPTAAGGAEMDEARDRMAGLLGVLPDEVSFGPSTTQNTYVLAQAFRRKMQPGDAVVVTNQDHEANTGPWRRLVEDGFEVREWKMDGEGRLHLADLENLLDDKVRVVAFPHCSNIVAEINDVPAICAAVRAAGAVSCVDGVSYAPHGLPDVAKLGADIYLFSTYKTYGPHQGIMVTRNGVEQDLPNQGHWFNADYPGKRLTPAGPDHAQVAACAGIADYMDALSAHHGGAVAHDLMRAREVEMLQPLLDWVSGRNDVRLLGPADAACRAPTVALQHDIRGEVLAERLAEHGIMAGGGDFYAVRLLDAMGVDPAHGVLRVSAAHYTSDADMAALMEALDAVL
ncbi:aminotransferase class V-fold PLP-dependent enzyme [Pontivivens insulae]|uniref:Putative cysteine desulfurase n=1 Tax=Pontivivens insulae TaxID=1639689 RepID=A0A2R8ACT5_9RHOB|nr:aminotransferase class V-fold PLP-dependent enzyme [Pontivivens insulae]RED13992.1 selenocysteine lyase/cysteine desulfurase [Pontivivens insulae]SPF30066.1 putative cysteine desulfurase [Pontivivens insulae]